jgi:TonB family protein
MSRLHPLDSGSSVGAWSVLETKSDSHGEDAPPIQDIPCRSSGSTARVPGDVTSESVLVALTLVLNEIAHQARSITAATGSAVLLIRGGVPVCSSISGANAREASAYLSECYGLANLSWRESAPQRCPDSEVDSRFDPASCRRLGIRSFMMVPVQGKQKSVIAIVQIFSPHPQAFSDRDLLALQGLGQRIADDIELAERTLASPGKIIEMGDPAIMPRKETASGFAQWFNPWKLMVVQERRSLALGIMIIGLSILLGWTLGRSERNSARGKTPASTAPAAKSTSPTSETPTELNIVTAVQPDNQDAVPAGALTDGGEVKTEDKQSQPNSESHRNHPKPRTSPVSRLMSSGASPKDLVIFENGQQIFPVKSPQSQHTNQVPASSSEEQTEVEPKDLKDLNVQVSVSEDVAREHLLKRIEPDYPEYAREQRLQGTVILNVNVGKDGTVHSLSRVAGDSQLTLLAAKAVRQWKFAPLVRGGAPVSFDSQVTLDFVLP